MSFDALPWSWSKIQQAQRCSWAMLADETTPTELRARVHPATEVGRIVHQFAQDAVETGGKAPLPVHELVEPAYFANAIAFVTGVLPGLKKQLGQPVQVLTELGLRLDKYLLPVYGWPNGYIVGKLDLALHNPESCALIILDHKTGIGLGDDQLERARCQLQIYSLLFHRAHAPVMRVGLALHQVLTGELTWLTDGLEPFDEQPAIHLLRTEILAAMQILGELEPTVNEMCCYCDHRERCDAYQATLPIAGAVET